MAWNPDERVTLTGHGTMKLSSAVARAMMMSPRERKRAKILREGDPEIILEFEEIKSLSAKWAKPMTVD